MHRRIDLPTRFRPLYLLVAMALAGCAELPRRPVAPGVGDGVVILTLTGNTARVGQFDRIVFDHTYPDGRRTREILAQAARGMARDTALFIGALPVGEYALAEIDVANQFVRFGAAQQERVGKFKVAPGGVHDLGRLVLTALNIGVVVGRSALVTSNAELIRRFSPENAHFLDGKVDGGWMQPRTEKDLVEEYALSTPVGADEVTELPDGMVVAASRLGSILVRSREGRWGTLHTGSLESILALSAQPEGPVRLVAVGEFDTIATVDAKGKVTRLDPGNLPPGNLIFVDGDDRTGWYVALQSGSTVSLLRSPRLAAGEWTVARTFSSLASFFVGTKFWAWHTPKGFGCALNTGEILFHERGQEGFQERRAPGAIAEVRRFGASGVGIQSSDGAFTRAHLSRDGGATWEEVQQPSSSKRLPPQLSGSGDVLMMAGNLGKVRLRRSTDAGASWRDAGDQEFEPLEKLWVLPSGKLIAVEDGANSFGLAHIRTSTDDGKTWRYEYTNFNKAAYEKEKNK